MPRHTDHPATITHASRSDACRGGLPMRGWTCLSIPSQRHPHSSLTRRIALFDEQPCTEVHGYLQTSRSDEIRGLLARGPLPSRNFHQDHAVAGD